VLFKIDTVKLRVNLMIDKRASRLEKLKALMDRGEGGEKENAKRMYEKLRDEILTRSLSLEHGEHCYQLALRVIKIVLGDSVTVDRTENVVSFDCNDTQYSVIDSLYSCYIVDFELSMGAMIRAYFTVNGLFDSWVDGAEDKTMTEIKASMDEGVIESDVDIQMDEAINNKGMYFLSALRSMGTVPIDKEALKELLRNG